MEQGDSFNVEEHRLKNDSSTEWKLRRRFLLAFHDQFPLDRLLCLACCYINSECYGNRYPGPVMQQLAELKKDLPRDDSIADISHRAKTKVAFVKAKEQEGAPSRKQDEGQQSMFDAPVKKSPETKPSMGIKFVKASSSSDDVPSEAKIPKLTPPKPTPPKPLNFVKSTDSYQSTDLVKNQPMDQQPDASSSRNLFEDEELKKFYCLAASIREASRLGKNAIETLHMGANKARMTATHSIVSKGSGFHCELKLDFVKVGTGEATNKKAAKHNCYENALFVFSNTYLKVVKDNPDQPYLKSSPTPFIDPSKIKRNQQMVAPSKQKTFLGASKQGPVKRTNVQTPNRPAQGKPTQPMSGRLRDLSDFLIIEPAEKPESMRAATIISNSAAVNKVLFESNLSNVGNKVMCTMTLGGFVIARNKAPEDLPSKLKSDTAEDALKYMRSVCWTIQTKKTADTDEDNITHEELLGSLKSDLQIGNSNIGNQLLKKMGWSGGGLGKKGNEGIEVPIEAGNVINREGLGLRSEMGIKSDFLPKMRDALQQYTRSNKQTDLVFSPHFKKEERALIHSEARKFGLKTRSHGTGEERYLILSRKRSAGELFNHVARSGGETSKYILLPPGSVTEDNTS